MSEPKAKKVSVTALKLHTLGGKEYKEGASYEVEADQVESLVAQGMAKPTHEAPPPPAKPSHPVEPMTTEDLGVKPKPKK